MRLSVNPSLLSDGSVARQAELYFLLLSDPSHGLLSTETKGTLWAPVRACCHSSSKPNPCHTLLRPARASFPSPSCFRTLALSLVLLALVPIPILIVVCSYDVNVHVCVSVAARVPRYVCGCVVRGHVRCLPSPSTSFETGACLALQAKRPESSQGFSCPRLPFVGVLDLPGCTAVPSSIYVLGVRTCVLSLAH